MLNLLGEKFLELSPAGAGQLGEDDASLSTAPQSAYDIVGVFGELTDHHRADRHRAAPAGANVVADTMNASAGRTSGQHSTGISRLSQSIASRDEEIQTLLASTPTSARCWPSAARHRAADGRSDLVFQELRKRKAAIHRLLVNARILAEQLRGLVDDNQAQLRPVLREVHDLTDLLIPREKELKATLRGLGPYARILGNIIGTGPWFDAYVVQPGRHPDRRVRARPTRNGRVTGSCTGSTDARSPSSPRVLLAATFFTFRGGE